MLRKAMVVIPKLEKVSEQKPSETKKGYTAVYVERSEKSERWIINPTPKDGIVEVDLKNLRDLSRLIIDR